MRSSALVLLLPLAACFAPNPTFGLAPETSSTSAGSSETSAGTTPTTTLTTAMTTASGEGTQGATAGATSEPLTSTSEPATSEPATSDGTTLGDTGGDTGGDTMPACELFVGEEQIKHVLDFNSEELITECAAPTKWFGRASMVDGTLFMQDDPQCDDQNLNPDLILGEGWPSINDHTYKCAKATVYWNHVGDECRIAALSVVRHDPVNMVEPEPFFLAGLSLPSKPPNFLLWPGIDLIDACGCEGDPPCCAPDPGTYQLTIPNGPDIGPGDEAPYVLKEKNLRVKNIQSYVGPGCQDVPGTDIHFDWFAERTD